VEEDATVSLTADVTPWEAKLDQAADKAREWGSKVSEYLGKANNFSLDKIASFGTKLKEIGTGGAGEVGSSIGTMIGSKAGAALGTLLGPGLGTMLGDKLGGYIGSELGQKLANSPWIQEGIADLGEFASEASKAFEPFATGWDNVGRDANETFDDIKNTLRGLPTFDDLFTKDSTAIIEQVSNVFDSVMSQVDDFVNRSLYRLQEAIDKVWSGIQEPAAKALDYIQQILVEIGLVTSGTEKWGDKLRGIKNIGQQVVEGLAYAFGFIEGLLKKLAGYYVTYITVPMVNAWSMAISKIGEGIKMMLDGLPDWAKDLLGDDARQQLDKLAENIANFDKNTQAFRAKIAAEAKALADTDPLAQAEKRRNEVGARLAQGKEQADQQDFMWEFERLRAEREEALAAALAGDNQVEPDTGNTEGGAAFTSKAVMAQSQEANDILQRALTDQAKPMDELVAYVKTLNESQLKGNDLLLRIAKGLENQPKLGGI
jgi:hypothetical protein